MVLPSFPLSAGAMKVTAGAAVLIERSVFDRNLGPTGGAITLDTNSTIIIQVWFPLTLPALVLDFGQFADSLQTVWKQFVHVFLHSLRHPLRLNIGVSDTALLCKLLQTQTMQKRLDVCPPCPALPCPAQPSPTPPNPAPTPPTPKKKNNTTT